MIAEYSDSDLPKVRNVILVPYYIKKGLVAASSGQHFPVQMGSLAIDVVFGGMRINFSLTVFIRYSTFPISSSKLSIASMKS